MKKFLQTLMLTAAMLLPFVSQSQNTQTFDFEDGLIPADWSNVSPNPWVVTNTSEGSGHQGTYCIMSGNSGVSSSQSSLVATFTFAGDGSISFLAGIYGEGTSSIWDHCTFKIDGQVMFDYGALATWSNYSFDVEAGTHTFEWFYSKDGSVNPTGDAFYLDNIVLDLGTASGCARPGVISVSNITGTTANISWLPGGTETSWNIYIDSVFETAVSSPSCTITGLSGVTTYLVSVEADCGSGQSSWRSATFTTDVTCPTPTALRATLTPGDGTVATLTWNENGNATAWQICLNGDENNLIDATDTTYSFTTLTPETAYTAKVRAVCGAGDSSTWSSTINFTPTNAYLVTVNDGTSTNERIPIYGYWCDNTTKSQFIIPSADLTPLQGGIINKLVFYSSDANVSWGNAEFDVYLTTTGTTSISELAEYTTMSQVYAGSLSISDNTMEVNFTSPFVYMGGNLMIGFLQTTTGSYVRSYWYGVSATGASMGGYGTNVTQQDFLPKTSIYYIPGSGDICLPVTSLTVSNVTADAATLTWSGSASSYTIINLSDSTTVATISDTTYSFTNLDPMTQYNMGVIANCGTDQSMVMSTSFTTACAAVSLPYTESFEATSGSRGCWTFVNSNSSNPVIFTQVDGRDVLRFSSYSNASDYNQYGYSPLMNVGSNATSLQVSVTYATYGSNDNLYFGYITPTDTVWNFNVFSTNGDDDFQTETFVIPATATQLAVHYYGNYQYYAWIDSVVVTEMSGDYCFAVTGLAAGDITSNSVTLTWNGDAANYNIYIDSTLLATTATTTYTISGLNTSTAYNFGVQAVCSAGSLSDTVYVTATTTCPDITVLPYTEGFENGLGCWTSVNNSTDGMDWSAFDCVGLDNTSAHTGGYVASSWSWNNVSMNADAWLISPRFVLPNTTDSITFSWWDIANSLYPDSYSVAVSTTTNDITAFTVVRPSTAADGTWTLRSIDLTAYAGQSIYVAFHHLDYDENYLLIDDIALFTGNDAPAPERDSMKVTVAVNDATMGTTVPAPGVHYFYEGDTCSVVAVPATGYLLEGWTIQVTRYYADYDTTVPVFDSIIETTVTNVFDLFGSWVVEYGDGNYEWSVTANFAPAPTCLAVTDLAATAVTETSVTLSWTGSAASYDIYNGTTFVANTTNTTYTVTGLTSATSYTFAVQAICSATDSAEMTSIVVNTTCGDITTLPYIYGFEDGLGCWNTVNGSADGEPWYVYNCAGLSNVSPHSGSYVASSWSWNSVAIQADAWLISPHFVLPTTTDSILLTWWEVANSSYPDSYSVAISTTTSDTTAFTVIRPSTQAAGSWTQQTLNLSAYAGQSVYIAFHHVDYDENYLLIDDIALSVGAPYVPDPDTLTVTFAVNNAAMGTTNPAPGTYQYLTGDTVSFSAMPSAGSRFVAWLYTADGVTDTLTDYISAYAPMDFFYGYFGSNVTLTAVFEAGNPDSTTITYAVNDATMGTTDPAPGTYTIYVGNAIEATAIPNAGYHLEGWAFATYLDGDLYDADTIYSDDPDFDNPILFGQLPQSYADYGATITVTAIFAPATVTTYTVSVSTANGDMGSAVPIGNNTVVAGESFTVTAYPNAGYHFVSWTMGDSVISTANPYTFTVNSDVYLVANFAENDSTLTYYTLTVTSQDNEMGSVSCSVPAGQVAEGTEVTVTATANEGYRFRHWVTTGGVVVSDENPYTFTMTENVTLTAIFERLDGIDDVEANDFNVYSVDNRIVVKGVDNMPVYVFDVAGRMIDNVAKAAETVEFTVPSAGVYLVKAGNASAKRVVVLR